MTHGRSPLWRTTLTGHISLICPILSNKKMKRYTYYIIALLATVLFSGCGETEYEYSRYPCRLVFDNTANRSPALASAMNVMSPGVFCRITMAGNYFNFSTNQGLSDQVALTAIDQQVSIALGVYNGTGIIVGYGNLNNPATFYVYDSQCPNCYHDSGLPRYSLTMNTDGTAECGSCHRKYDMNNGGIVSSGDGGDKMIRYRAGVAGDVLNVNN